MKGIRIGELLVEQGLLTQRQVREILREQADSHRPFGDLAERLFGVGARHIEDAWVEQYVRTAGLVDLEEQRIDVDCLRRINRRQAWQFQLLPTHFDGQEMCVVSSPDRLVRALNFAGRAIEDPIYMMVADREQLSTFLMRHYPVPSHIAEYAQTL